MIEWISTNLELTATTLGTLALLVGAVIIIGRLLDLVFSTTLLVIGITLAFAGALTIALQLTLNTPQFL